MPLFERSSQLAQQLWLQIKHTICLLERVHLQCVINGLTTEPIKVGRALIHCIEEVLLRRSYVDQVSNHDLDVLVV